MKKKVAPKPRAPVAPVAADDVAGEVLVCNSCDTPLDGEGFCGNSACGGVTTPSGDVVTRAEHDALAADMRAVRDLLTSAVGAPKDAPLNVVAERIKADLRALGSMLGLAGPAPKGDGK